MYTKIYDKLKSQEEDEGKLEGSTFFVARL